MRVLRGSAGCRQQRIRLGGSRHSQCGGSSRRGEITTFLARLAADAFIAATPVTEVEAEAGMAGMSKVFRETGIEFYMGAGGREHD